MKILDFLKFGQRCLGWFWLIEKWLLLVQFDVWKCLGLSIVDLGQLISLEPTPKASSEKVGKSILKSGHNLGFPQTRLGTPVMVLVDLKVVCTGLF